MPSAAALTPSTASASRPPRALALDVAVLLILANGALDAYTFLAHDGVFATAQTGNIVLFALGLVRPDVAAPLPHLWPILAFVAGISLARVLHRPDDDARSRRPRRWVLVVQVVVLSLITAAPTAIPFVADRECDQLRVGAAASAVSHRRNHHVRADRNDRQPDAHHRGHA